MLKPKSKANDWRAKIAAFLACCLFFSQLYAGQLYRYKDESGNLVLNRTIPPALVGKGYDILNEKGRLIKSVPPALTPEQIAARDAEKARQERLAAEAAERKKADNELRQLYSHPNDAVRALKRKVQDIRAVIQVKRSKIESAQKEIVSRESKAANMQRNGINIPDDLIRKIKSLKTSIINSKADISELESEEKNVLAQFDQKIKRLEVITKHKADEYLVFLEKLKNNQLTTHTTDKKS